MYNNKNIAQTTFENILETVKNHPESRAVLESLFPSAFDTKPYCKLGVVLKRDGHPNNLYALFKWNGEVRFLNITGNRMWKQDRNLVVNKLYDETGETITLGEFRALTGLKDETQFTIIENLANYSPNF